MHHKFKAFKCYRPFDIMKIVDALMLILRPKCFGECHVNTSTMFQKGLRSIGVLNIYDQCDKASMLDHEIAQISE